MEVSIANSVSNQGCSVNVVLTTNNWCELITEGFNMCFFAFLPTSSFFFSPFDKDELVSMASSVNRGPTVSKRFSTIFNQSPPDTPSLREQAFYVGSVQSLSSLLSKGEKCFSQSL